MSIPFGLTTTDSTSKKIFVIAKKSEALTSIVGKMVFLDVNIENDVYRCLGTIIDVKTVNIGLNDKMESASSKGALLVSSSSDLRKLEFTIQATFRKESGSTNWVKHSSALPTSPGTFEEVSILEEEDVKELTDSESIDYPTIGFFRGLGSAAQPLDIPDFGGEVGAKHTAVIGRSGSGKTAMYTYMLAASMKHEQHAIVVIDPQGQWANEQGMVMSLQNFAKGLGRKVDVLRVSEDIKLPMSEKMFSDMVEVLDLWKNFRRMGKENKQNLNDIVANHIAAMSEDTFEHKSPRDILGSVFGAISESQNSLNRIYVKGDRQDQFKRELQLLAGITPENEEGEMEIITEAEKQDVERNWASILSIFTPLINLFSRTNLSGGVRKSLSGNGGVLSNIFKIRQPTSEPAPYVILDMSPNTVLHAKSELLSGKNNNLNMQVVLDNQDVKALIITMILDEIKKASETAFVQGGGNLNTQIVFDEAWRYAPEGKATPMIEALATKLEGFALDTRKFGIGWTYILQSPSDLKTGIWRQLSFVHVGYGLVGEDTKKLESLTDDVKQIDLYRQFIPPASTKVYPFMLMGPISPVIFTTAPTFINVFNTVEDFLLHNLKWIKKITDKHELPKITVDYLKQTPTTRNLTVKTTNPTQYVVGQNLNARKSKPQIVAPITEETEKPSSDDLDMIEDTPF